MSKTAKTLTKIVLSLFLFATFFMAFPQKAYAITDMELGEGGYIRWESETTRKYDTGWRYYTKYWHFTITKINDDGSESYGEADIFPAADGKPEGGYTNTTTPLYTDADGNLHSLHQYALSIEVLEKASGLNLKTGKIKIVADAVIGFHYAKGDGTYAKEGETYKNKKGETLSAYDGGTYKTFKSAKKAADGHKIYSFENAKGLYQQNVKIAYYCITIAGDNGYDSNGFYGTYSYEQPDGKLVTKEFQGSEVWVPENGNITAYGTTKYGYKSNGSETKSDIQSNLKIKLTSTPWQHQVIYDTSGGSEAPEGFTKIYTETKYLSSVIPTKPGYTFVEWKSSTTGKTYQPGDLYDHAQDGGTDTLVAQWKENTYTFVFDGNGGTGTVSDITVKYSGTLKLPANGFVNGECLFLGWDHNSGAIEASYQPNNTIKVANIVKASGLQYKDGAEITIYALWNAAPRIDAEDRYFSLAQAQSGYITMEELFQEVTAYDVEDGAIEIGDNFYIESYDSEIYKNFTIGGFCSETFVAVDSTGYVTKKMIKVHIVDTTTRESSKSSKYNYVRFISLKYLDYPEYDGGFLSNSIWRETDNYNYLKSVLSIQRVNPEIRTISVLGLNYSKEVPGTGEWNAPIAQEWYFTKADIDRVKEYINTHGFGNSKEPDALAGFLEEFKDCRVK